MKTEDPAPPTAASGAASRPSGASPSPAPAQRSPSPRRRLIVTAWVGAAAVVGATLLAARLQDQAARRAVGDYIWGVSPALWLEVRAEPSPHANMIQATRAAAPAPTPQRFAVSPEFGGVVVLTRRERAHVAAPPPGSGLLEEIRHWWRTRRAGKVHHVRMVPEGGPPDGQADRPPEFYQAKDLALTDVVLRLERFPPGMIAPVVAALHERDFAALRLAAEEIERVVPGRATVRHWIVSALLAEGRTEEAAARFATFEADLRADPTGRGATFADALQEDLAIARQPDAARRIATYQLAFGLGPAPRWPGLPLRLPLAEYLAYVRSARVEAPLPPPSLFAASASDGFLAVQVASKVVRVWAVFEAIRGDVEAAHDLFLGQLAFGRPTLTRGRESEWLIARAVEAITVQGMEDVYLGGPYGADQLAAWWPDFVARHALRGALPNAPVSDPVSGVVLESSTQAADLERTILLGRTSGARFGLFMAAYRVRHYRAATGRWPEAPPGGSVFDVLLLPADAPHRDPFSPAGELLRARPDGDDFLVYSIGPDGADDGGAPLAWATAADPPLGDITLRLTPEPRYDFPLDPAYLYEDYHDFDRRYPHGLPADPFSHAAIVPMRLARDGSHRVWSFGPDADQGGTPPPFHDWHFDPLYDPTNGTTSDGDLWIELPLRPDAVLPPPIVPAPPMIR